MEGTSKYHPAEPAGSASTTSSGTPSLPCGVIIFIPSNPTAQETEMGPSIPYLPSYDHETNGTTFSYKNTRFSYADGPAPAGFQKRTHAPMGHKFPIPQGKWPAPRRDFLSAFLSYGPAMEKRQLHEKFETSQIRKHYFQLRPVSCSGYTTTAPCPTPQLRATSRPLVYPAIPLRLPSAPFLILPLPYPTLSLSCPFHIPPFPYPGRVCIMNPYPPQHQERTPL